MRVLTKQPYRFVTGDVLDPRDLNATWNQAALLVDECGQRRYTKSCLVVPFAESCGTPVTNATPPEARTFRFLAPVPCILERAYFTAHMSSTAEVKVVLSSGGAGVGAAPLLTTKSPERQDGVVGATAIDVADISAEVILLQENVEYAFSLQGSGFSAGRFDLVLHLCTDRWTTTTPTNDAQQNVPIFGPSLVNELNARSATTQSGNLSSLNTQAAKFASSLLAPAPILIQRFNTVGGGGLTDVDVRSWSLPRFDTARATSQIVHLAAWVYYDANVTTTFDVIVKDASSVAIPGATLSLSLSNETLKSGSMALAIPLNAASSGISALTASDYRIDFLNNSATNARRAYALLWVSR